MELVETTISPVERRTGTVRVLWTTVAEGQRRRGEPVVALVPGDGVLLLVDEHTFHSGRVLRYDGSGRDRAYLITVGVPMGRRRAGRRTEPAQDVRLRVVPAQRASTVSLSL